MKELITLYPSEAAKQAKNPEKTIVGSINQMRLKGPMENAVIVKPSTSKVVFTRLDKSKRKFDRNNYRIKLR